MKYYIHRDPDGQTGVGRVKDAFINGKHFFAGKVEITDADGLRKLIADCFGMGWVAQQCVMLLAQDGEKLE